jgi:hypothetical protein
VLRRSVVPRVQGTESRAGPDGMGRAATSQSGFNPVHPVIAEMQCEGYRFDRALIPRFMDMVGEV